MKSTFLSHRFTGRAPLLAGAILLQALELSASTSANYSIIPDTLDGGGGQSSSANYSQVASIEGFVAGTSTSANYSVGHGYIQQLGGVISELLGQFIFYNGSTWDGGNTAANASDDLAIATDKTPLLPGGIGKFANYTSYSRGINGIMVDVLNLPGPVSASDFSFRMGNTTNLASSNLVFWASAPAPASVSVRSGAGVSGSDRVTLIWANGAISNKWLEVQIKPTAGTGLSTISSFFFGNAIGETGNSTLNAAVTSADAGLVLQNLLASGATISNRFDVNRTKSVTSQDSGLVLSNLRTGTAALQLINLTGYVPVAFLPPIGGASPSTSRAQLAMATVDSDLAMEPGVRLPIPELITVANGIDGHGKDEIQIWFRTPTDDPVQVYQRPDLTSPEWTAVPAEQVLSIGDGFHQVRIPAENAGSSSFFRFTSALDMPSDKSGN